MKITDLKIGDLVQLLSTPDDGPAMTVLSIRAGGPLKALPDVCLPAGVICGWQGPNGTESTNFHPATLKPAGGRECS